MIENSDLLKELLKRDEIRIHDGAPLWEKPQNLPPNFDFDRVAGMLLGVAIGDSLGANSESLKPSERHRRYGEIRDYLPGRRTGRRAIGVPTDDTQMTFWTLAQLLEDGGLVPDHLAKRFCFHKIRGIGGTTRDFVHNYQKGIPWNMTGKDSIGNGALMRIAPVIVPYLHNPSPSMNADAALDSMVTHNSYGSNAACVAYSRMLWSLLGKTTSPAREWWLDSYCSVASVLEGNTPYSSRREDFGWKGPIWEFVDIVVRDTLRRGINVTKACESWGSRSNLLETVPSVLYILAMSSDNIENAVIRAINDTEDNDTVGSIVGAAAGALHGAQNIPKRWLDSLTGRTLIELKDDGEVWRLIQATKESFWKAT